jgi:hypothetical protein
MTPWTHTLNLIDHSIINMYLINDKTNIKSPFILVEYISYMTCKTWILAYICLVHLHLYYILAWQPKLYQTSMVCKLWMTLVYFIQLVITLVYSFYKPRNKNITMTFPMLIVAAKCSTFNSLFYIYDISNVNCSSKMFNI